MLQTISIDQELNIMKSIWHHLNKSGCKKELNVYVQDMWRYPLNGLPFANRS